MHTFGHTRTLDSHASRLRRKLCGEAHDKLVDQRLGRRLSACGGNCTTPGRGPMSEQDATPHSVDALYQQLAAERAGAARAALARERTVQRAVRASAAALEDAAGALLHAA